MYKTATDGDELFTMQPDFGGANMVEDKTTASSMHLRSGYAQNPTEGADSAPPNHLAGEDGVHCR